MNKFVMELVWHNCYDCPPEEYWNDDLYITRGDFVHSAKYDKERGWWSRELGDYIPIDILWEYWWADLNQTVQNVPRFRLQK